jgi:hypothetical protein
LLVSENTYRSFIDLLSQLVLRNFLSYHLISNDFPKSKEKSLKLSEI